MKKDILDDIIVVKRSGQRVQFNSNKIAVAIKNAFDSSEQEYDFKNINKVYENVLKFIESNYSTRKTINVEDIQDIIENELKKQKYFDIFEEFSQYRKKRAESRQAFTIKQQHKFSKAMEKICDEDLIRKENGYSPQELLLEYGNTVLDEFVKSYIIDNKYLRMHEEGNIYIENFSNASIGKISDTNIDLRNKFENCSNLYEIIDHIINISNEIDGEIHITDLDNLVSMYFIKLYKQELILNIKNYLNVCGLNNYINVSVIANIINKSDFDKINVNLQNISLNSRSKEIFDMACDDTLAKIKEQVYNELNLTIIKLNRVKHKFSFSISNSKDTVCNIIKYVIFKLLDSSIYFEYIAFIFKIDSTEDKYLENIFTLVKNGKNILIQNIKNDNNLNINLDLFSNGIRLFDNINDSSYSVGRMAVSETSINMARLGIMYKDSEFDKFYLRLGEVLDLVKNELLLMFENVGDKTKDNYRTLFDNNITYDEKLESGGKIRKVIKNGVLLIGLVGLKECVEILSDDIYRQYELLNEIIDFINDKCNSYRMETKLNFYIFEPYSTKCREYFMELDKSIYGIKKGITDKECYGLICNSKCLIGDSLKMGNIYNKICGGFMLERVIKDNVTYKKFLMDLDNILENNIGIIKFRRNTG